MIQMSELHRASVILDIAAVFIVVGMIRYTSIYRSRGNFCDRLYFWMCIDTILMAIADAITYILDGGSVPYGYIISIIGNNIFFISLEIFAGMVTVHMDHRSHKDISLTKKRWGIIMIPAFITTGMILFNNFYHYLFWVRAEGCEYYQYPAYRLIFVALLVYGLIGSVYILRIDKGVLWLFVVLIVVRFLFGAMLKSVSSTPALAAIGLAFIHMHYMREPFYEGEKL